MSHGIGAVEALQSLLGPLVPLFALLTQLADVWFMFVLLSVLYLAADRVPGVRDRLDRQDVAYVVALAVGALALTTGLKLLFAHPRPPMAGTPVNGGWLPGPLFGLYEATVYADGYALPSGHALGGTAVYGGLALVYGDGISRRSLAAGAGLAGLVALSRVVIGVHYAGDVVVGVAVALGYLAVATVLTDNGRRVGTAFLLAVLAGVFALFAGGYERDAIVALGTALGGRLAWQVVGDGVTPTVASAREALVLVAVGLPAVGGLFAAMEVLEPSLPVTFVVAALVVAVLLALPVVWPQKNVSGEPQNVSR